MMKIAILGSALRGGGIQIIDILLESLAKDDLLIYDDDVDAKGKSVLGVPVVGPISQSVNDFSKGVFSAAVVAIGSVEPREKIYKSLLAQDVKFVNVISSKAILSPFCTLGIGNVILPGVYIGPSVTIGDNNYLTTASQINHDSSVGSHCYFSAGVTVAGRVKIGDSCRFDTSSCITADAVVPTHSLIKAACSYGPVRGR